MISNQKDEKNAKIFFKSVNIFISLIKLFKKVHLFKMYNYVTEETNYF